MAKKFKTFLRESIVDPLHNTLSPEIFANPASDNPQLLPHVQSLILSDLNVLQGLIRIKDVVLVGSILTKRYREDTDLDVHILAAGTSEDDEALRNLADEFSNKLVPGTLHPINYYIITNKEDHDRANSLADGVFNVFQNRFIRKPIDRPFDVREYFGAFQKIVSEIDFLKSDLQHELIDYEQLKAVSKDTIKELQKMIEAHLENIEKDAVGLVDIFDRIKKARKEAFAAPVTPEEIRQYGEKNRTPGNVVFKLMEKYHYLAFLSRVKEIIGDDKKVSDKEAEELGKIVKD